MYNQEGRREEEEADEDAADDGEADAFANTREKWSLVTFRSCA